MMRFFAKIVLLLICVIGCDQENGPETKSCRIKEMSLGNGTQYTFTFNYRRDGKLNSITTPNGKFLYEYDDQNRIKKITTQFGANDQVVEYEYPQANVTKWTSSMFDADTPVEFYLYHNGDKADSLKVIYPEKEQQPFTIFRSNPSYLAQNIKGIVNTSDPCCNDYTIEGIEYDEGLNPQFLMRQSTGAFAGYDILNYIFFGFYPQNLSYNNVTRYTMKTVSHTGTSYSFRTQYLTFEYAYSAAGSYPDQITAYVDGSMNGSPVNFVYENCE